MNLSEMIPSLDRHNTAVSQIVAQASPKVCRVKSVPSYLWIMRTSRNITVTWIIHVLVYYLL